MTIVFKAVKVYFIAGLIIAGLMLVVGQAQGAKAARTAIVTTFTGVGVAIGLTDDAAGAIKDGQAMTGGSGGGAAAAARP